MRFSFEMFPPRTPAGRAALSALMPRFAALSPEFVSVTCGAGGDGSTEGAGVIDGVMSAGMRVVPHLTCSGASRAQAAFLVSAYEQMGVHAILALRGDAGAHEEGFADSVELAAHISSCASRSVFCAGYPEPHPDSRGAASDLDWIRRKADAGAREIITQYCFDAGTVLRYRDEVSRVAPEMRVRPGVLPVRDVEAARRFSARCGASVPETLFEELARCEPGSHDLLDLSAERCRELLATLSAGGVDAVHVYALNDPRIPERILAS